jgi:hypothetical protein
VVPGAAHGRNDARRAVVAAFGQRLLEDREHGAAAGAERDAQLRALDGLRDDLVDRLPGAAGGPAARPHAALLLVGDEDAAARVDRRGDVVRLPASDDRLRLGEGVAGRAPRCEPPARGAGRSATNAITTSPRASTAADQRRTFSLPDTVRGAPRLPSAEPKRTRRLGLRPALWLTTTIRELA